MTLKLKNGIIFEKTDDKRGYMISNKFQTVVKFALAIVILSLSFGCGTKNAHKHEYTAVAAKQATCTEVGNVLYYECSCGKFFVKNGAGYEIAESYEVGDKK